MTPEPVPWGRGPKGGRTDRTRPLSRCGRWEGGRAGKGLRCHRGSGLFWGRAGEGKSRPPGVRAGCVAQTRLSSVVGLGAQGTG